MIIKIALFVVLLIMSVMAHAQEAQPDTSAAITYIGAGVATILAIFVAKYGVKAAILIGKWAQGVIGR